jgi:methylthioribose-1-phosphate isomerase
MTVTTQNTNRLEAIRYQRGQLSLLDQLKLPHTTEFFDVRNAEEGARAIELMQVRGAPAIAVTAALSLAVEIPQLVEKANQLSDFIAAIESRLNRLAASRPTAVNLFQAIAEFRKILADSTKVSQNSREGVKKVADMLLSHAEGMLEKDLADNRAIGAHGADLFKNTQPKALRILTHCNTGSLATVGYGTALGVIRALHERGQLAHAYATETRPYNQGARLTAFELVYENIPATLVTDSMVSFLMTKEKIDAVVVGADRVVANGDTANKIGTYQLAIAAKYHNVPFYVAAPLTSIDTKLLTGKEIHIEERPANELTHIFGQRLAAQGIGVWNPSFDVTPAELISGIITEHGVIFPNKTTRTIDVRSFVEGIRGK